MNFLYNILAYALEFSLRIIALFNKKIRLFINGRKEIFSKLSSIKHSDEVIWIHSASLGEFEQAKPIIERIKKEHPHYKIVITFFSPSGYEIRKNYTLSDVVCYLPFDTKSAVKKFIKQVHPSLAIIIKYEFWPNLLSELKKTNTKTILVSGIFRKEHSFFKTYGAWMREKLASFNHFFVQDTLSKELLNSIGFTNVTVSGDTRFDRVYKILQQNNSLNFIEKFKNNTHTLVTGSSWKEDENLLVNYINNHSSEGEKFIIAPHNINKKAIEDLQKSITKKTVLFSEKENKNLKEFQVLIINTIGILTKIYSYADVAFVGGGFSTGLHNILEPVTFGIPVIFGGNKHQKFKEATDLITLGGCKALKTEQEFITILKTLYSDSNYKNTLGEINKKYVKENIGATDLILNYIKTIA